MLKELHHVTRNMLHQRIRLMELHYIEGNIVSQLNCLMLMELHYSNRNVLH